MHEHSLFNALDGSLASIDLASFERSLVLNILFQERVLVYDGSILTCPNVAKHLSVAPDKPSLFEVAARNGIVVPTMRDRNAGSLREQFSKMSKDYILPEVAPYCHRVFHAFDRAINEGKAKPLFTQQSQEQIGNGYRDLVIGLLAADEPPQHLQDSKQRSAYFDRLWEHTARWRKDLIEAAVKRTASRGQHGLNRQAVFDELGERFGVSADQMKSGYDNLYKAARGSPEDALAIEVFMRWLSQCQFINQARMFDVSINFPVYHMDEDFALDSIVPTHVDSRPAREDSSITVDVSLPDIAILARQKPEDLLKIREDLGDAYLAELRQWQAEPTLRNRESTETALKFYCAAITAWYKDNSLPVAGKVTLGTGARGKAVNNAISMMKDATVGTFVSSFRLGAAIYNLAKTMSDEKKNQPRNLTLEISARENF